MSRPWDLIHVYRWWPERLWPRAYWVRMIDEPRRRVARFVAAADRYRLDYIGGSADRAAGRLVWFGLQLDEADKLEFFVRALKRELDRVDRSLVINPRLTLNGIAIERSLQHLTLRLQMMRLPGYRLTVRVNTDGSLTTFLFLENDVFETTFPRETYVEKMIDELGVFSDSYLHLFGILFELEAELYKMSFNREGGDLEGTSSILLELARKLAKM
jgi:hypothetical protein